MIVNSRTWDRLDARTKALIARFQAKPPVDLRGLARALGVPVKAATLPPNISGEIRPDDDGGYVIRVSRHDSPGRQRFTVAHELAHYLLHRGLIGGGITDDALYRSGQSDSVEAEANRLAADILMPAELIKERRRALERIGVDDLVESLAETFEVSPMAISIRLEN
jgi:Zn-dependent peptidase ImmA (M78 family)